MLNLLRAELYQLRARKGPLIWLIASIILSLFIPFVYYLQFWVTFNSRPALGSMPAEPLVSLGYVSIVQATAVFLLIGLGNTAYNDETKNRTFINTVSTGHSRTNLYLAKFISGFLLAFAFLVISALTFTIASRILFFGDLSLYVDSIVNNLILQNLPIWLMYLAIFQLVYAFSTTNALMSITILILIALPLILQLLSFQFDWIAQIEPYVFTQLSTQSPIIVNDINLTPWIAILYLIFFLGLGIILFKRKEIK